MEDVGEGAGAGGSKIPFRVGFQTGYRTSNGCRDFPVYVENELPHRDTPNRISRKTINKNNVAKKWMVLTRKYVSLISSDT